MKFLLPIVLLTTLCGCTTYPPQPGTTRIGWFHRDPKPDPAVMKMHAIQEKQVKSKLYGVCCQDCNHRFRAHPVKMQDLGTINPGVSGGPEREYALYFACPTCECLINTIYHEPITTAENHPVQIVTPVLPLPAPIDTIIWNKGKQ